MQKVKATTPQVVAPLVDEQAIKSAIKGLINSSRVKLEYVQAIAEPLGNEQIPESYWKDIFDSQGANNALKQGIYSPQMVRLLMLRAIAIPQTLPEYLVWLGNGSKGSDNNTLSVEFQSHIKNSLIQIPHVGGNIEFNVVEGIRLLLPKLLEQKVTVESVVWLLSSANGLWASFSRQVVQEIDRDLQSMNQSAKGSENVDFKLSDKSWQNIRSDLKKYWQIRHCAPQEKYQPFAELFNQLHQYKLSIFFYHICLGKVPKKVFVKLYPNVWHCLVYGISIEREVTTPEVLLLTILKIGSIEVRVPFVVLLVMLSLGLGLTGGNFWASKQEYKQEQKVLSDSNRPVVTPSSSPITTPNAEQIPSDKKQNAINAFSKTETSIQKITDKAANKIIQSTQHKEEIKNNVKKEILKELYPRNTDTDNNITLEKREKLINAIYFYQVNKMGEKKADGRIGTDTVKQLETALNKKYRIN